MMEINPAARFRQEIRFGICLIIFKFFFEESKSKIYFTNNVNLAKFTNSNNLTMNNFINIKIAVDFDGTIVEHEYPAIGKEKLFAFQTLKELQKMGANLILWTFRSGKELDEAIEYCRQHGIEFYAINKSYPEEIFDNSISRKIDVDIYIDDKNLGGFPGWSEVWQILNPYELHEKEATRSFSGTHFRIFQKLFKKRPLK
jgi:flagellar basal body rod protein FlgG